MFEKNWDMDTWVDGSMEGWKYGWTNNIGYGNRQLEGWIYGTTEIICRERFMEQWIHGGRDIWRDGYEVVA